MSKILRGWAQASLGEIVSLSKSKANPQDTKLKTYVGLEHIESSTRKILSFGKASDVKSTKNHFIGNDILYGKLRPYLNKVWRSDREGICSTDILVLSPEEGISSGYVERLIFTPEFVEYAMAHSSGINLPRTKFSEIKSFALKLPPANEQKRIVAKLEKCEARIDAAREALDDLPKLLEHYRQSVLAAAFRGDLTREWREQNPDAEPAEQLLKGLRKERRQRWEEAEIEKYEAKGKDPPKDWKKKYKAPGPLSKAKLKELPKLPERWCWATVEELAAFEKNALKAGPFGSALKKSFYVPSGFKIYGQEQVIREDPYYGDYYIDEKRYRQLKSCAVSPGDILISLVGTIGKVLILPKKIEPGIINPRLVKVSLAKGGATPEFLKRYLESPISRTAMKAEAHGGTMDVLNLSILRSMPVPVAPLNEQTEISRKCDLALLALGNWNKEVISTENNLNALNHSLLSKAFRGELVTQDPNDAPASKLLLRIAEARKKTNDKPLRKEKQSTPTKKIMRKPIIEAFQKPDDELSPEELFQLSGFSPDEVEEFYAELKLAVQDGRITESREDTTKVSLSLKL